MTINNVSLKNLMNLALTDHFGSDQFDDFGCDEIGDFNDFSYDEIDDFDDFDAD